MDYHMTVWTRDWEEFEKAGVVGRNASEGLSDAEMIEYLRWMACNRPQRSAYLMTAVIERRIALEKAIIGIGA